MSGRPCRSPRILSAQIRNSSWASSICRSRPDSLASSIMSMIRWSSGVGATPFWPPFVSIHFRVNGAEREADAAARIKFRLAAEGETGGDLVPDLDLQGHWRPRMAKCSVRSRSSIWARTPTSAQSSTMSWPMVGPTGELPPPPRPPDPGRSPFATAGACRPPSRSVRPMPFEQRVGPVEITFSVYLKAYSSPG